MISLCQKNFDVITTRFVLLFQAFVLLASIDVRAEKKNPKDNATKLDNDRKESNETDVTLMSDDLKNRTDQVRESVSEINF